MPPITTGGVVWFVCLKTRDWKTWDQIAGVEKAGLENAEPNFQGGKRTTTVY